MDTSRIDGVKAPQHRGTPRSHLIESFPSTPLTIVSGASGMATWSSQVGPVFAGAVAVALKGAVGAFACGACNAVAETANAKSRRAMVALSRHRPARGRDVVYSFAAAAAA